MRKTPRKKLFPSETENGRLGRKKSLCMSGRDRSPESFQKWLQIVISRRVKLCYSQARNPYESHQKASIIRDCGRVFKPGISPRPNSQCPPHILSEHLQQHG